MTLLVLILLVNLSAVMNFFFVMRSMDIILFLLSIALISLGRDMSQSIITPFLNATLYSIVKLTSDCRSDDAPYLSNSSFVSLQLLYVRSAVQKPVFVTLTGLYFQLDTISMILR